MFKSYVQKYFRRQGLAMDPRAAVYLGEMVERVEEDRREAILDRVCSELLSCGVLDNAFVTHNVLTKCVKDLTSTGTDGTILQVINAMKTPILAYHNELKGFYVPPIPKGRSHFDTIVSDNEQDKSNILLNRYTFIMERLLRNNILHFSNDENDKSGLKKVEFLLSSGAKRMTVMVLGMLTEQQEGVWCLEDVSGIVKIDIEKTIFYKGLVLEGSFVLAEGIYEDHIFKVNTMGLPPLESAKTSRDAISNRTNYFGGLPIDCSIKQCPQMTKIANKNMSGKSLVFISELWLDKEVMFSKLETMFSGYSNLKPGAFILCGNFLSTDMVNASNSIKMKILKRAIKRIVLLFATFRDLALNSHLIFVPGPNDPYQSNKNILPRASLSEEIFLEPIFTSTIPNLKDSDKVEFRKRIILASNPCRITYFNKEIVVFRDDVGHKVYRHCLYIPVESDQTQDTPVNESLNNTVLEDSELDRDLQRSQANFLEYQLAWTLLSQAHLMPLPMHVSPVYWGQDQALRLFPTPDVVVLSDPQITPFDFEVNDCLFMNPPSFSNGEGFKFMLYYPYTGEVQSCSLNM